MDVAARPPMIASSTPSTSSSPSSLKQLYSIMQGCESRLGGGEGVEGIYGSITSAGMSKIFECMRHNTGFGASSYLIDIGAGLGRPQLHAAIHPGIRGSLGIELDQVKVTKAKAFIKQTLDEMHRRGKEGNWARLASPEIVCGSVEKLESLEPATHAYSFWEGIHMSARASFGLLFKSSSSCKAVTVVQRSMRDPAKQMLDLGFGPLILIATFAVKMSGSGASFQAYVFSKASPHAINAFLSGSRSTNSEAMPLTVKASLSNKMTESKAGDSSNARKSKRQRVNLEDIEKDKLKSLSSKQQLPFRATRTSTRVTRASKKGQ